MLDSIGQRYFPRYNIKEYLYKIFRKSVQYCDLTSLATYVRLFQKPLKMYICILP